MKLNRKVVRKDTENTHVHTLKDGTDTMGPLPKPSQSTQFPQHSHLYQHDGETHETGIAFDEPGHTHDCKFGETGGPHTPSPKESFGPRNDSLSRIGSEWQIRTPNGDVVAKGRTPEEAASRYDSEEYDEAFARQAIGVQDEDKWSQAKMQSQNHFKAPKWPYIQHAYKLLGGK